MPKIKFTALKIKTLKQKPKSIEYFDSARQRGSGMLGLRVSPRGKKTWFLMYTVKDKVSRWTLGVYPDLSLADARKQADKTMTGVNAGNDPVAAKTAYQKSETFSDMWEAYLKHKDTRGKAASTMKEERRKYEKVLKPALGDMKVSDIKRKDISRIIDDMAATAPVNANRLHALLSVIFNRVAMEKEWITANPMPRKKPSAEVPRDRDLSKNEIRILWPAFDGLPPNIRDIFKLILLTGQRPGEVYNIEWSDIDFEDDEWTIPREKTKTKKYKHVVPLSAQAMAILKPRADNGSKYVFPSDQCTGPTRYVHKARGKLQKETGITDWTSHDLRRTAKTIMSRVGVAPYISERVLGHLPPKMEQTYDRYQYLAEKRRALNKLGDEIDRIVGKGQDEKIIRFRRQA